ncbi:MAG TPA: peptidase, partial [Cytophagales bacterium]|nr:peptidase [Cytophagales bacterium]
ADLPVNPEYVTAITDLGAAVYYTSRWMNAAMFEGTREQREAVLELDMVDSIWYVAGGGLNARPERENKPPMSEYARPETNQRNAAQNELLGIPSLHGQGYTGDGVLIAVFDGGFLGVDEASGFQHLHDNKQIVQTYDFVGNRVYPYGYDQHGTRVLSTMASFITSGADTLYLGAAYEAQYILCVTEDVPVEYRLEEFNWLFGAELADSAGADIIHSSLGYSDFFTDRSMDYSPADMDGITTIIARSAQFAADRGILVVTSAGNSGGSSWNVLTSPADVPDVLAVGAISFDGSPANFTSRGLSLNPVKPDVSAWGVAAVLVNSLGGISEANGTSYSAPQVAGLAAGLWQAFPELSAQELIDIIRQSGDRFTDPDTLVGYGVPNFIRAQRLVVTGLGEDRFPELSVYPNPNAGNTLTIELPADFQGGELQVIVFSTTGSRVSTESVPVTGKSLIVNTEGWETGSYFLRIESDQKIGWARVVKP